MDDFLQILTTGVTVTSGVSSSSVAIPNDSSARPARFVRLQATGFLYVKVGGASVAATTNDLLVSPTEGVTLTVAGNTNIAYLQETAAAKLNIMPVEG